MVENRINESWDLKTTENLNQMLRVNGEAEVNAEYSSILIIKHNYHAADDLMFPDPSCLAFFTAFEENHLAKYEDMRLVAVDIFEGAMTFYIYVIEAQKSLYDCISFFKSNPNYRVDFEIKDDKEWLTYKAFKAL